MGVRFALIIFNYIINIHFNLIKDKNNLASHNIWSVSEYTKNINTDTILNLPQDHSLTLNHNYSDIGDSCIDLYYNITNSSKYPFFDYIWLIPSGSTDKTVTVTVKAFKDNGQHNANLILNMDGGENQVYVSINTSTTFREISASTTIQDNATNLRLRFVIWQNEHAVEDTHLFIDNIKINIQ